MEKTTLEPDGTAAACKAALQWVRLPPASLTKQATVDVSWPVAHSPSLHVSRLGVFRTWVLTWESSIVVSSVGRAPALRNWQSRVRLPYHTAGESPALDRRVSAATTARGRRAFDRSAACRLACVALRSPAATGGNTQERFAVRRRTALQPASDRPSCESLLSLGERGLSAKAARSRRAGPCPSDTPRLFGGMGRTFRLPRVSLIAYSSRRRVAALFEGEFP